MHHLAAGRAVQRSHSAGIFFLLRYSGSRSSAEQPVRTTSTSGQHSEMRNSCRQARTVHRVREGRGAHINEELRHRQEFDEVITHLSENLIDFFPKRDEIG